MSLRFRDLWGGGYPPPPAGSKLAQTPAGARVNERTLKVLEGVNPISGRLLATPISGKGGLFRTPP